MSIDIIEAEVGRPTIFKAENKLTSDYLPEHLLFREGHMKTLTGYFKGLILQPTKFTQNVVVMGGIGIGKTALVKRFGMNFEQVAQKYGVSMKYIHVNCRKKQTNFLVLLHIIHELDPHFPSRGYSSEELMETLLGILENRGLSLLLCLDEVDFLVTKNGSDLIYSLVRISDDKIDRRGKGEGPGRRHELSRMRDRLDVEDDRMCLVLLTEVVDEVGEADIDHVADRNEM